MITTAGDLSAGILAQSVGGGGGTAGAGLSESSVTVYGSANIAVGGTGGSGGSAGKVSVRQAADIVTTGRGSAGIVAQSIGGGMGRHGDGWLVYQCPRRPADCDRWQRRWGRSVAMAAGACMGPIVTMRGRQRSQPSTPQNLENCAWQTYRRTVTTRCLAGE